MHVTTADKSDKAGAIEMLACNFFNLPGIKKILVDGGYAGTTFADFVKTIYGAQVEVVKLPKRWIAERSFGWLYKNRRLWMRNLQSSIQFTVIAFTSILLKRY